MFNYDHTAALSTRQFFQHYRDKFPILGIIIGGYDGDTPYDSFENLQVFRVHCYSSQSRVVAKDSRQKFLSIPVATDIKFRVIKGHTKVGNVQELATILKEHELPVLVSIACLPQHDVHIGRSRYQVHELGNLVIEKTYTDHYLMLNCIDSASLKLNPNINLAALSDDLEAAPITGFKLKGHEDFQKFLKELEKQAHELVYDMSMGNPEFIEYASSAEVRVATSFRKDEINDPSYETIRPPLPYRDRRESKKESVHAAKDNGNEKTEISENVHIGMPISKHLDLNKNTRNDTEVGPKQLGTERETFDRNKHKVHEPMLPAVIRKNISTASHSNDESSLEKFISVNNNVPYQNLLVGRATVRPFLPEAADQTSLNAFSKAMVKISTDKGCAMKNSAEFADEAEDHVYSVIYEEQSRVQHSASKPLTRDLYCDLFSQACQEETQGQVQVPSEEQTKLMLEVKRLTIKEVGEVLEKLCLGKYREKFESNQIDGEILSCLSLEDFVNEMKLTKIEAVKLDRFVRGGHVPK